MKFDPTWNTLGLYFIPSSGHYTSYFLKRSWGNYLFFPHPEVDKMYPFILSCGGIYKVFDFTTPFPFYNKQLFDKFGAPTIGTKALHHPDYLIEHMPEDYFDVDLKLGPSSIQMKIQKKLFLFKDTDSEDYLDGAHHLYRYLK
jgi:hypothetical protein